MRLSSLHIANFRNLATVDLELSDGIHALHGANAQGKTNLLEAIHYLVTGRSFRTRSDIDCVPWSGAPDTTSIIKGTFLEGTSQHAISVAFSREGKNILLDGKKIERLGDLVGKVKAILFLPDDLMIAKGAPQMRRVFLDATFSLLSVQYLRHLQRYAATLRERNALLKCAASGNNSQQLASYDALLIESGVEIYLLRDEMIGKLSHHADSAHRAITERPLELRYLNFLETDERLARETARSAYAELLEESRSVDLQRGATTIGPHRDDLGMLVSGFDLRTFGSQGEQRTAVVCLRLGCIRLTDEVCGQLPLLLLDDIFSELDAGRSASLLALLTQQPLQTILTSAEPLAFLRELHGARLFRIEGGQVVEEK
jgi:DNA replication and repair protein RecF